ncbi:MAG: menaquinone biosynthesis decarboxylase [Spirochaetia bacterium]|nr:menaquinone biosynthesis decarboxylase [Spirochaetia bacterium]
MSKDKKMEVADNLREFMDILREAGELLEIKREVDPCLEITEIADRAVKEGREAILFHNVKNSPFPLLINMFGSKRRMELSLGVNDLNEIGDRIMDLMKFKKPEKFSDKFDILPKLMEIAKYPPKTVKKAPCQEVILNNEEVNLDLIPVVTCWPKDAGPFITLPMVITKNPETGIQNIGMYRLQKYDKTSTGMHWHLHKGGAKHYKMYKEKNISRMPVAVAIGGDPASIYSASAPLPPEISEYIFSGFLRRKNIELVKATQSDLLVPAEADFILEGFVDTSEELKLEGMFGDHTGFYSLADYYPVFHVTAITHRKNAVYPTTIVGIPPMEDAWMGFATERIFIAITRILIPEITDFHMPPEGTFHNLIFVKIKKEYPGQAMKVMHGIWGLGLMALTKIIVVVDDFIDIQNAQEVWWYALANIDPQRDIIFSKGPTDILDHASSEFAFHTKMGIDGTKKMPEEGFKRQWPDVISMDSAIKEKVNSYYSEIMKDSKHGKGFR